MKLAELLPVNELIKRIWLAYFAQTDETQTRIAGFDIRKKS